MRKLLFLSTIFYSYFYQAQVETTISVTNDQFGDSYQALLYTPNDYNSTSTKYPLIVFLHGAGESNLPLSNIYNNASAGGPAYFIEHAQWPTSFTNPTDGLQYKFLVVSPQAAGSGWSSSGPQLNFMIQNLVSTYRVDTSRIYITGLSAGGAGCVQYVIHQDDNGNPVAAPRWKVAGWVPMSEAFGAPNQTAMNVAVADSAFAWGFGDAGGGGNDDIHGFNTQVILTEMNNTRPGMTRFTNYTGGHCCWGTFYNPTYTEVIGGQTMNIYQWMLTQKRVGASTTNPTANAGSNQSITQPTSTVTLTGTGTAGTGHTISTYAWAETSGPSCTITPTSSGSTGTTVITNMNTAGTYNFQLTVTNNVSATATSTVSVTVVSNAPVANAGGDQTVTLPTNSTTLNGTGSTGTITSWSWTELSGPNSATITNGTTSIATVSNLTSGSYVFKLSVNGGVSTSTANVIVNPVPGPCHGTRKYLTPDPTDSSVFMTVTTTPSTLQFVPGDTIAFKSSVGYSTIELHYITGSPNCPIVFTNEGGQAWLHGFFKIYGAKYVHIDGTGAAGVQYGLKIQRDLNNIVGSFQNGIGLQISERSKVVEINNVFINHTIFGLAVKQSPDCPDSLNYPNWIMDTVLIHDNYIRQVGLEGMYIGDTSPDNSPTSPDPRPVHCNIPPNSDSVIYPRPIRSGHFKIYNNIVDSTERGGIQLSGHSVSVAEIYGNTVMHNGMDGDEQQGTGISIGLYTEAYIHNNIIKNNTTWGIASLGGAGTNIPLRIENNVFDSIGYGNHYSNVTDTLFPITPTTPVHGPTSGIPAGNDYTFAIPIFVKTVTNMDHDSTQFSIKGNSFDIWLAKAHKTFPSDSSSIQVFDYAVPVMFQKSGNFICNNTQLNGAPASVYVDQTITNVPFSTNCPAAPSNWNFIPVPGGFIIKFK
jgi:poly(3-hydroxybutyrate) depolymerase